MSRAPFRPILVNLNVTSEGRVMRDRDRLPMLMAHKDAATRDAVILDRDDYVRLLSHDDRLRLGAQ